MHDPHFPKNLLTGNDEIDNQHRELFQLVQDLRLDIQLGNQERARITFQNFLDYIVNHFTFEEMLMYKVKYPKEALEKHRLAHRTLQEIYLISYKPIIDNELPVHRILELFESYFLNHLLEEDCLLAEFVTKQREENPDEMAQILASLKYE